VLAALFGPGAIGQGMAQGQAQFPQPVAPCVACQVLSVRPAQVDLMPAHLTGVTVAIRVSPGEDAAAVPELARRGALTAIHVTAVPAESDPVLAADATLFVIEPGAADPDQLAFALKRALAAARGRHPQMRLLVAVSPQVEAGLRAREVEAYLDGFVAPPSVLARPEDLLTPAPSDARVVRELPADASSAAAIVRAAVALAGWFPDGLAAAPDRALHCGEDRSIPAFLNPQTLDLVGVSGACPAATHVTGDAAGAIAERLDVGGLSAFRLPAGNGERFAEGVTVGAARTLSADEIVARHQAAAARQAADIHTDLATGTLTLTFEAPTFAAPVTVTSTTTMFSSSGRVDLRQSDIRVNGVPFSPKDGIPKLPILEPERAAAMPLAITLTSVYRYTLEGRGTVDGRRCYVIGFSPRESGPSLFDGRAWIDEQTFGMARVSAAQTGLKGAIVASEQTDTFVPDAAGRWLLARSDIRQTYEGASIRTPIHRLLAIARHDVNASDFASRRAAAYASGDVMLRDTPAGLRYLKPAAGSRQPAAGSGSPDAGSGEAEAGSRQLVPPITHIRTFAAGVIVDPNITTPLPFAGLSYVDFDLWHTGAQFSGFFGGSYAQASFSAPSVAGSRWQIAGRAFAIGTSYNDRAFSDGREIYTRDIQQRPAQAAVWALRPVGTRAAVRLEYDWDYNRFTRSDVTDPAFVVPRSQNAHGLRAGIDLQRAGWQASLWASHTVRAGWERWGVPGSDEDASPHASFQRFGASLFRTAALSPRLTTRLDASIVGGRDLDRFSRISFGTFDNRLHGYPSALIRYDRGAVVRGALSWAAAPAVRLDGFADTAFVHDPAFGAGLRGYTGFGAALECPAPFGTLFALEWGYGVQGINSNGTRGTQTLRVTGYKVF
jgi:hypothetical protein